MFFHSLLALLGYIAKTQDLKMHELGELINMSDADMEAAYSSKLSGVVVYI